MATPEPETAPTPTAPPSQGVAWRQFFFDLIETFLIGALLYIGINAVSVRVRVDGFSMRPTLQDGEFVLVNRLAYQFDQPQRGDIIVFRFPADPGQDLIKRIIGLPGDTIRIADGKLSVNGQVLDEPYIAAAPAYQGEWQVSEGSLFVLGDNRNDSSDSHAWGLLPQDHVIGKAVLIYWPPPEWELISRTEVAYAAQ